MAQVNIINNINGPKNQKQSIEQNGQNRQLGKKLCLLPLNEQLYISSILTNTFVSDFQLVSLKNETQSRKKLRKQLVQLSLSLGAYVHILFSAFFYQQKYLNQKAGQAIINQLLPITCLVLARKYQKGRWPNLESWGQKANIKIQKQKIQELQNQIVQTLRFQLQPLTRYTFMSDIFLKVNINQKIEHFCSYLLEQSVFLTHFNTNYEGKMMQFSEGQIGISIIRLGCYFFKPDELQKIPILQLGYNMQRIHQCCSSLFELVVNKKITQTRRIRHKYKKPKFMEVGKIEFFKIKKTGSQKQTADENQQQK